MIKYEDENYLTTEEAAKYLGKSSTAFRQFFYRNDIFRRKLGGRLYFPQKVLDGYFAKTNKMTHFESSGLSYDEVYSMAQLQDIFLTSKQNIYAFIKRHNIERLKDNTNQTLYHKAQVDEMLAGLKAGEL